MKILKNIDLFVENTIDGAVVSELNKSQVCKKCGYRGYENIISRAGDEIIQEMKRDLKDFIESTRDSINLACGEDVYKKLMATILNGIRKKYNQN